MAKEVRFNSPDQRNPGTFKLHDLMDERPYLDDEFEVIIEWHEGTYGSKVPSVVITRAPKP